MSGVALRLWRGILAGFTTALVTMCGLGLALDGLMDARHGARASDLLWLLGLPFLGAALAKRALAIEGKVIIVWLGGTSLAGLWVGMQTRPWPYYWGPDEAAAQANALWVGFSVLGANWAAASLWFALPRMPGSNRPRC